MYSGISFPNISVESADITHSLVWEKVYSESI